MRKTMTTLALTGMLALGASQGLYAQTGSGTGSTGSGTGTSATDTTYRDNTNDDRGHNWGWIGLLGLAGLMGLRRHEPVVRDTRDVRSPNPASR